jgi:hypothetical protein
VVAEEWAAGSIPPIPVLWSGTTAELEVAVVYIELKVYLLLCHLLVQLLLALLVYAAMIMILIRLRPQMAPMVGIHHSMTPLVVPLVVRVGSGRNLTLWR